MSTPGFIKSFRVKYRVAFIILLALSVFTQVVIQVSLYHEQTFRVESTILDNQRSRELYYADIVKNITLDPAHRLDYIKQLEQNNSFKRWQDTEKSLYTLEIDDSHIEADFQAIKPHYELLKWAYLSIIAIDGGPKPVNISKQLTAIIQHDNVYVFTIYDAYKRLDTDANNQVVYVVFIEAGLFVLTLAILNYENWFAIRPAVKQLTADVEQELQKKPAIIAAEKKLVQTAGSCYNSTNSTDAQINE